VITRTAVRVASAVLVITALGVLGGLLIKGPLSSLVARDLDTPARTFALHHTSSERTQFADRVSSLGSAAVTGSVAAAVAAAWWIRTRNARAAVLLVSAFAGAAVVAGVVKFAVHRRPVSGSTSALTPGTFPSGHTLFAVAVYGVLAVLVVRAPAARAIRIFGTGTLAALIVAVAAARVYLLQHYLSDVLASIVLGVALIASVSALIGTDLVSAAVVDAHEKGEREKLGGVAP
jgi:undecaprenyl-diphosphatase